MTDFHIFLIIQGSMVLLLAWIHFDSKESDQRVLESRERDRLVEEQKVRAMIHRNELEAKRVYNQIPMPPTDRQG